MFTLWVENQPAIAITSQRLPRRDDALPAILVLLLACFFWASGVRALAQEEEGESVRPQAYPRALPEDLGLAIPRGKPIAGKGRRVLVRDLQDKLVVGRLHVEVANQYVVVLPNGRLICVPRREATFTDRPFEPVSKEDILAELKSGAFKDFKSKSTARFLYIFNTSEAFSNATSRILETMYPTLVRFCRGHGMNVHDPEFPMVVIMFRSREEFDAYRQTPPDVAAYYNIVNNYIVMYEQSELTEVAPELALKTSISMIAHEGVHQILFNIGVQQRLSKWPQWISEGLPEYFAPTETGKRIRWKGLGLVNDMRMYHLIEVAKEAINHGGPDQRWFHLNRNIHAERLDSLGYAKAWGTVYVLARHRKKAMASYLQAVSNLAPLEEPEPGELFEEHFGDDYDATEEMIVSKLRKVKYVDPIENSTYFVGIFENRVERRAIIALSPMALRQWRSGLGDGGKFAVKAFPSRTAARQAVRSWIRGR